MSIRTERVAGEIKSEIGRILQKEIDTTGFGLLTVTDVIMTADLKLAKVYVSHYPQVKTNEEVLRFFEDNKKLIRMAIGRAVRLKTTPEVRFFIDETMIKVERIETLIRQIHEEERNR
jgi:ribosome-binding factor A